jgi:hypothetical protein
MKKLQRNIIRFVRSVEPSIQVVFHDGPMESDSLNKRIYINTDEFIYTFSDEVDHKAVMKENGLVIDIMLPTYILLHEIGHVVSFKKYNTSHLLEQYEKAVDGLVKQFKGLELLRKYKALKLEREADKYAYSYYIHNYAKVKALDTAILELTA